MTGQLNPHPSEVMARNIRPAGVMCAFAPGLFCIVMDKGTGRISGTMPFIGAWRPPAGRHASPDIRRGA